MQDKVKKQFTQEELESFRDKVVAISLAVREEEHTKKDEMDLQNEVIKNLKKELDEHLDRIDKGFEWVLPENNLSFLDDLDSKDNSGEG